MIAQQVLPESVDLGWEARPDVWQLVIVLATGYAWANRALGPHFRTGPTRTRHGVLFYSGLAVLWVAVDWPIDKLGDDYMMSAHMAQYLLLTLVAAPLLLAGTPDWLFRELTRPFHRVLSAVSRPVVALLVFDGLLGE